MSAANRETWEMLAKILLRCGIFSFILLFIWLGVLLLGGDTISHLHSNTFGLSAHELNVIFYCGMGLLKLLALVFFWIPWLAIRHALPGDKG